MSQLRRVLTLFSASLFVLICCSRCGGGAKEATQSSTTAPPVEVTSCKESVGVKVCGDPEVVSKTTFTRIDLLGSRRQARR